MYDAVFSLGSNCEAAHQLRRNGVWNDRGPFDWMVTPFNGLMKVLEDDGQRLGDTFVSTYNGTKAASADYGCVYFHEFPPTADGKGFNFSPEIIAACRSKMQHKWKTLKDTCQSGKRVLFVRFRHVTDAPGDEYLEGATFGHSNLNALATLLAAKYPQLDFHVLFVTSTTDSVVEDTSLDHRISVRSIDIFKGSSGNGSDEDWDAIYQEFDIINTPQTAVA